MSEILANRYQIVKCIGKGGMADVYLALDTILNREVAVKILKNNLSGEPLALERFHREANASLQLVHPNIVDVYDVGDDSDRHFIVMEYVKGYTLKQLIKKRGAIPYKEAVWLMKQLTGALMEAHKKGIIHRDVKSQNVLIKDDGTVKMADFGIAIANGDIQITSENSVLGSVHYLAPELAKGAQANMQSDIYSLGIVFYELLTGEVPYKGDSAIQVALMHVKGTIPSVRDLDPHIPQSVENIIIKATAKSLNNRYENAALMLRDLNQCLTKEHMNDPKLDLNAKLEEASKDNFKVDKKITKEKTKKTSTNNSVKGFNVLLIFSISLISILCVLGILLLSGVIGKDNKLVIVPSLINRTIYEADDILDGTSLTIDKANIERVLTESISKDIIIETIPSEGSQIEKGSAIKVVVSDGIYTVMADYIGKDVNVVKESFKDNQMIVTTFIPVESDLQPGIIVSQTQLAPGDKYDPNRVNYVTFEYSAINSINIPLCLGKSVEEVKSYFADNGFEVTLNEMPKDYFDEYVLSKYGPNTVCSITPQEGETYVYDEENSIVIEYYVGDSND